MIRLLLRDLQWRWRRQLVGVLATALVLAMTLLLGALSDSFLAETDRTVALFKGDTWVVPTDTAGPFTSNSPIQASTADTLASRPDVRTATPVAIFRHAVEGIGTGYTDVSIIGFPPGGAVEPTLVSGQLPAHEGEAAADERVGAPLGQRLTLAGRTLTVVGLVRGLSFYGGTPGLLLTLADAQDVAYDGSPLASAIVVSGRPGTLASGLTTMTPEQVRDDLRRPLEVVTGALGVLRTLLWVAAAGIIALLAYLAALDRERDLVVFKALGVGTGRLIAGVLLDGMLTALLGAAAAIGLGAVLLPWFPLPVTLSGGEALGLLAVSLVAGALAAVVGLGRVLRADPARAFAAID